MSTCSFLVRGWKRPLFLYTKSCFPEFLRLSSHAGLAVRPSAGRGSTTYWPTVPLGKLSHLSVSPRLASGKPSFAYRLDWSGPDCSFCWFLRWSLASLRLAWTHSVAKDDLELYILLPPPFQEWVYRCKPPSLVYEGLGPKLRASWMLGKPSSSWVTAPSSICLFLKHSLVSSLGWPWTCDPLSSASQIPGFCSCVILPGHSDFVEITFTIF